MKNAARCVLVLQSKDGKEIRFRNLNVEKPLPGKSLADCGSSKAPHRWTDHGVIVAGKKAEQ